VTCFFSKKSNGDGKTGRWGSRISRWDEKRDKSKQEMK
jgi:hypothetical protein